MTIAKYLLIVLIMSTACYALNDTIAINKIDNKIDILSNKVDEVKRDQINYSIEKNLLKETYRVNYERINLFIAVVLAVIGVLSYFGLKDINRTKTEYKIELEQLRKLKEELIYKIHGFEESTKRLETHNKEQDKKIQQIELKEKITSLYNDKKYDTALDYCLVALEQAKNDVTLLDYKARLFIKLQKYDDAIKAFLELLNIEPMNESAIIDLIECYLFAHKSKESDELLANNRVLIVKYFGKTNHKIDDMLIILDCLKLFNLGDVEKLRELIKPLIDSADRKREKKNIHWNVEDALTYVFFNQDSSQKTTLINYLWYLQGTVSGFEAIQAIGQ